MELTTLFDYLTAVRMAKLDRREKALLYFYATTFNWKDKKPSRYGQRTICSLTGMAQGSYNEARDKLEELGWIKTLYLGRRIPVNVWVRYGIDDPNYEKKSWAKWHPSVKDIEKRYWEIVSEYVAEGRDIDALLEFSDAPADGIAFAEGRK